MKKILFIDRDGCLIAEPEDEQVDSLDKFRLMPGVIPALLKLRDAGFRFVMVSNQDGLGTEAFPEADFRGPQELLLQILESQGIAFDAIHIDPTLSEDNAPTRKPGVGMLLDYLRDPELDRKQSAVIGDRETDLELADNMGLRGFRIGTDGLDWPGVARALLQTARVGEVRRKTRETDISVRVDLDATGPTSIGTGIGFFDHMLEQVAAHGGFALSLQCKGDLEVDEHHTVEDCALALGAALDKALGDRSGIGRYGFLLPMDESLAQVAVDLSGRPAIVFDADFPRESVGGLHTEMVEHFFASLAQALRCAIHVKVEGENTHHMVEACFKGVGRALRPALARTGSGMPSTKGML
ncbi:MULTISPECIES: bifunctional histidinol-phosphatase/imidazoleglycerol-phosphate dehydratase HisB [unclassified Wenzhouxiangella]|uniref:bifunctional histidinol-phosphatase/imidazoleglycerol-phosphate dehydratase HisB n=1 Tax=unclassified Wenzhouxiangella TaxID=2613841 RepID=UPI000E32AF96|nr:MULTISPECIES: bifunctional histidinol-phosphatase/imidazoleglycerol-phosphate dehydratase HisB [unclassified Wenzhouxiangella]RFF27413.1 bifunctional histidinol-phosphatase/imidazoleglycerol-phosphate dehydratase HisB [Wenzhouxiangella sp. 15181]RFP68841.1 bifunctional histidinol-phosphatase/imidazoleglycerol-phosphate dehydratase HisB [Wenzhouxiangella sp. 15190]